MMKFLSIVVFASLFCSMPINAINDADLIIFSFDRPMQIYSLLESIERYISGIANIFVLYRTSNNDFYDGYQIVKSTFPTVRFIQQGEHPHTDFKKLTLETLFATPASYILFAVDDIIVTDFIDLNTCVNALQKYGAYGFYLRLGTNITTGRITSEIENIKTTTPTKVLEEIKEVENDINLWQFNISSKADGEWRYVHTVDMTLYKKEDIKTDMYQMPYYNPNSLEGLWACKIDPNKKGLCFNHSKMVNIPLNRVQNTCPNNLFMDFDPQLLLNLFNKGLKIDINQFYQFENISPHIFHNPTFITR